MISSGEGANISQAPITDVEQFMPVILPNKQ
jgi:hypothetical protein